VSVVLRESGRWGLIVVHVWAGLEARHDASPVYSFDEILMLNERCARNIRLFAAHAASAMVAGVVVYDTGAVARAQYIASNDDGRSRNALDLLFTHLLEDVFSGRRYFDMGSSDGSAGDGLNRPLIEFKEGFGARSVVLDTYELDISPQHASLP